MATLKNRIKVLNLLDRGLQLRRDEEARMLKDLEDQSASLEHMMSMLESDYQGQEEMACQMDAIVPVGVFENYRHHYQEKMAMLQQQKNSLLRQIDEKRDVLITILGEKKAFEIFHVVLEDQMKKDADRQEQKTNDDIALQRYKRDEFKL